MSPPRTDPADRQIEPPQRGAQEVVRLSEIVAAHRPLICMPHRREAILPDWRLAWICATTEGVPRRALWVTVIVGTLLNAINQGDALFGGGKINWIKLGLTYMIPYCVATYGAVTARTAAIRAASSASSAALTGTEPDALFKSSE
jgi:hypothetical protein